MSDEDTSERWNEVMYRWPEAPHEMANEVVLPLHAFYQWGVSEIAYVRPHEVEGEPPFAIMAADGRYLGYADSLDSAHATIIQNDLVPLARH